MPTKINDDHLNIDLNFSLSCIVVAIYRGTHILTFVTQIWLKGIFTNKSRFFIFCSIPWCNYCLSSFSVYSCGCNFIIYGGFECVWFVFIVVFFIIKFCVKIYAPNKRFLIKLKFLQWIEIFLEKRDIHSLRERKFKKGREN